MTERNYMAKTEPPTTTDPKEPKPPDQNEPSSDKDKDKDFDPPQLPTEEEKKAKEPLEAPEAVDPTAVDTVSTPEGDKKYGWQDPAPLDFTPKDPCVHMGIVQAKKQLPNHQVGHEWVCACGTIFVVGFNSGGKKTLIEKDKAVEVAVPLPVEPIVE